MTTSEKKSIERKDKQDKDGASLTSGMKVHKGPLNLSTITMRNPLEVMRALLGVIEDIGIKYTVTSKYSFKCEKGSIKFTSEINMIENLDNLYTIKFYKSSGDSLKYANLCTQIFSKLTL